MVLGLTLEGGGAKGSYQIGAWKAFRELGIEFQGITGTSVGALNGALMVQDDFDVAYEIWSNITPTAVMKIDDKIYEMISDYQLTSNNINIIFEQIRRVIKDFGINTKPLEELVERTVRERKIRSSSKDFGIVTVCLTDFKPLELFKEEIPVGKMADYLIASSYLPIFKSRKLDGKVFLDGGFYNNLPLNMLYDKGYREIVAVRLLGRGRVRKVEYEDLNVRYISPSRDLGNMLDFTKERARYNIKLGYFDTLKVFKNLKGKNYYIEKIPDEGESLRFLMGINEESIKRLGDLYNLPQAMPTNRLLLEGVVPKLIDLMELSEGSTYTDVVVGLIDHLAAYKEVEPFAIYSAAKLLKEIQKTNHKKEQKTYDSRFIETLSKNEFILRLNREKLLEESLRIILQFNKNLTL